MADAVNITPRPLGMEDIASTASLGQTFTANVLGVGPTTLTMIPLGLITQLIQAANDEAAGVAGVPVGNIYLSTTYNALRTRMS
jgi:hypothetical protein